MVRVTVVGAGIAGLTAALYAVTAGHHVVVLDRTDQIGGRATSQTVDGAPFGYGLHLLHQRGPLMNVVRKVSRLRVALSSPRLDRLHVAGVGALRPRNNVRLAAQLRRALKQADPSSPAVCAAALFAGSGVQRFDERYKALQKGKLAVVGEGWAGIVGRMAAALDEVGVLIEAHCQVESIKSGSVRLKDGRMFDSDVIVLACGVKQAERLLRSVDSAAFSELSPVRASTLDATLTSRPLGEKHGIIDAEEGAYMLDVANVQPKLGLQGSFLSAVMIEKENESKSERLLRFDRFLNHHAKGWHHHVLNERRQESIVIQTEGKKPAYDAYASNGILLAGEWVASAHELADAAADTGRQCGQNIA
tara:strand:+ start:13962 stop:15047 length:1086 start_codon:yes stop_codon:yes gene_type:complete